MCIRDRDTCGNYRLGPLKIIADGSLGAHTAALLEPYRDAPETKGILNYTDRQLEELIRAGHNSGMQIAVHCIGAVSYTHLDVYKRQHLPSVVAAWGMYISQGIVNFLIPSSSGQAVVVMPIMSSLADVLGLTRQTAVLAFQSGDGFWNMITPVHPILMASLGLAGVSFKKWFKFSFSLVMKWSVWVCIVLRCV